MNPSFEERLLLAVVVRFESEGLANYRSHAPNLETEPKRRLIADLGALAAGADELAGSALAAPVAALLAAAESSDTTETLCVQGMVLETLGHTIYAAAAGADGVSQQAGQLARRAMPLCREVTGLAVAAFGAEIKESDSRFAEFSGATHDVLAALDAMAEPVDAVFGERFDIRFSELVGDFTADLVSVCGDLEMPRRKILAHLAGASMGF